MRASLLLLAASEVVRHYCYGRPSQLDFAAVLGFFLVVRYKTINSFSAKMNDLQILFILRAIRSSRPPRWGLACWSSVASRADLIEPPISSDCSCTASR